MAANKTRAMTHLCDLTQCCICLKKFTDPRMLPCIHTFCFQCLQDLAEKSDKKPGDEIQCPVCRKEFTLPVDGIQNLQKNFFMASFVEVRHALNQSKMTLTCDICKANNDSNVAQISEATMRCLVCQENLCEGCCKMHKSFKMSKSHEIIKIGNGVVEVDVMKSLPVTNCHIHSHKPLDYYCADCKKVVCVSCFVESHKTHDCKDVTTVEEEFRQSIKSNANIISALAEELQDKRKKKESKEEFLRKIATRESEIFLRSKKLKAMIDEHTKSLLSSLGEIKNRHLKEIQVEEEELDRRYIILESFSRYCDELRTKGSAGDVCRSKDELFRRADELEKDHESYIMRPRIYFDVTFQATEFNNIWSKTTERNIVGMIKENVEQLEDICVVIGEDCKTYKVNLRRPNETLSCIQDTPSEVQWHKAAAVYDNTMFVSGIGKTLSQIWKYNFTSGWKRCGFLLDGREGHCAEFLSETLYICGGKRRGLVMDSIEAYNALTEKSAEVGQLKVGVYFAPCVAYKGSIYVFGGLGKDNRWLDCVQEYNPVDSICTLLSTPLPSPCYFIRCVLWENYAILLDQYNCFIFDLNERIWQERQQFKANAFPLGLVIENGRIFIVGGGSDDVRYVRASSIVNNEAANWKTHSRLPKSTKVLALANLTLIK